MKIARSKRPWWQKLIGRMRIKFGFCPECNSSAPELDNCPTCKGYHSAAGDEWPPSEATKENWWLRFTMPLCQHGGSMLDRCHKCDEMFASLGQYQENPRRLWGVCKTCEAGKAQRSKNFPPLGR